MISPPIPANEAERLLTLNQFDIFNSESDERFDRITRVVAAVFDMPIAMVNLIGPDTQVSKSCFGIPSGGEMERGVSFCGHTILSDQPLIVEDALKDERFADNPNVTSGLKVRAYAGIPLRAVNGTHPGALCMIDTKPRKFSQEEINLLTDLAAWAEIELNSSQLREALDEVNKSRHELAEQLAETTRLNELMVGRELKMVEMKKQIADLTAQLHNSH
ncbi:MAG TPA: GAF domain-containing protein [Candidatus Saccharimonadales bacterium]|nr:GAF domain-containing protein [Candidatus Saccharimonadales bacterium]